METSTLSFVDLYYVNRYVITRTFLREGRGEVGDTGWG